MTEKTQPNFGLDGKKSFYEQNIGKYYVIYPRVGGIVFTGKISAVKDGKVHLRPHQGIELVDGKLVQAMVERDSRVDLGDIFAEKETIVKEQIN